VLRRKTDASAEVAAAVKRLAAENAAQRDTLQQVTPPGSCNIPKTPAHEDSGWQRCLCGEDIRFLRLNNRSIQPLQTLIPCQPLSRRQELQRLAAESTAAAERHRADGDSVATSESALADLRSNL
jgi:hypothetical protein